MWYNRDIKKGWFFVCQILMVWLLLLFHRMLVRISPLTTHVTFLVHGQPQTGVVTKQLKNAAVVEIDETQKNNHLMVHSNGVIVINYKQLKKI